MLTFSSLLSQLAAKISSFESMLIRGLLLLVWSFGTFLKFGSFLKLGHILNLGAIFNVHAFLNLVLFEFFF